VYRPARQQLAAAHQVRVRTPEISVIALQMPNWCLATSGSPELKKRKPVQCSRDACASAHFFPPHVSGSPTRSWRDRIVLISPPRCVDIGIGNFLLSVNQPSQPTNEELDRLLFEMLTSNDHSFGKCLVSYYQRAIPELIKYVSRDVRHWLLQPADVEALVEDTLSSFILAVGVHRRDISKSLSKAVSDLEPVPVGEMHARLLAKWKGDVEDYRRKAVGFKLSSVEESPAIDDRVSTRSNDFQVSQLKSWREVRDSINSAISPLQRRGIGFLSDIITSPRVKQAATVRAALLATARMMSPDTREALSDAEKIMIKEQASALKRGNCADSAHDASMSILLSAAYLAHSSREGDDLDNELPGARQFTKKVHYITLHLPDLSVRSHDYLRTSCRNGALTFLDKRKCEYENLESVEPEESTEPFADSLPVIDYRSVIRLLRKSLAQARRRYLVAKTNGKATREFRTLTKRREKYLQVRRVMYFWKKDLDERAIITNCGMTRSQVRYALEQIKNAVAQTVLDNSADSKLKTTPHEP
jgi:hypothetical protein